MAEAAGPTSVGGTSKEKVPLNVKDIGLTQIDGHPESHQFIADIVFVHGLQGHPQRTWQSKSSEKNYQSFRKRIRKFSLSAPAKEIHEDNKLFWPAELLPRDLSNVRILTYGYDSKVTKMFKGPASKNGIFQHGRSFLEALSRARIDCDGRPIIFVAHSLGGLIVKQALIEARKRANDPSFHYIYNYSHAVIFFGTPHRGSNTASWGRLLSDVARATQMDTSDGILIDLDPKGGSSKLEELRLDFDDVLRDSKKASALRIFSFQEEKGMTGVRPLSGKVVPDESSSLDSRNYGSDTIHANHMEMCRFEDGDDDGYEKFKGVLSKFIAKIMCEQQNATQMTLQDDATRRADILDRLDYAEKNSREHQLRNIDAKEDSISWILLPSGPFKDWLLSGKGLFWISGKPGSGKSTLMDYLVRNQDQMLSNLQQYNPVKWIILRFFFDFRGGKGVTNSFEGLLRSLLHQLIPKMPKVDVLGLGEREKDSIAPWPVNELRDALCRLLRTAENGVLILVDGLDEYQGSIMELIQFLRSLAISNPTQQTLVKICVSSRSEPMPSQLLQHLPQLSMSDHNASGIRSYCFLALEGLDTSVRESLDISELSRMISERAEGVFLWARFALEQLVHGHFSGETLDEIELRLNSIPDSLEEIYDRMLDRMESSARKECMTMLQLVCFAKTELSWDDHFAATQFAMGKDLVNFKPTYSDRESANRSKLQSTYAKRLRAKAVGLLELVDDENGKNSEDFPKVKLIHRSVSTYLDQKGWQILGESEPWHPARHESWYVEICIRYLHHLLSQLSLEKYSDQDDWKDWWDKASIRLEEEEDQVDDAYPFFKYAAKFVFEHARSLEEHSVSSYPILHGALTKQLARLHVFISVKSRSEVTCLPCLYKTRCSLLKYFEPIYVAFLHGLVLYCKSDIKMRIPAPGQVFWERALTCAIHTGNQNDFDSTTEVVSLALQNITSIQQHHIEDALLPFYFPPASMESLLGHESVKDLRLTDSKGHEVKLLWLFSQDRITSWAYVRKYMVLIIAAAERRGEDVRRPCGPEGNLVETLLGQRPSYERREKLMLLREFYESMSWAFEYDVDEIERVRR